MNRNCLPALLPALLFVAPDAADSSNRLSFPLSEFSITPLEAAPGQTPWTPLIMSLPPVDGFSANVNVQVQPFAGTLDEYAALSQRQFSAAGCKVLSNTRQAQTVVIFEYTGKVKDRSLHWYARAVQASGRIYLVTATSAAAHWDKEAPRLKACVDSFRLSEIGEQGAAPDAAQPRR